MGHNEGSTERKVIAIEAYLRKIEKSLTNNLTLHLQELEEQQQTKPRASRRKEIIKSRAELNDIETKKKFEGSINPATGSLKRINKIDVLLTVGNRPAWFQRL